MLDSKQRQSMAISFKLTPALMKVFELLLEAPLVTNDMVEACVDGDGTPARLVIYRLRVHLGATTIRIHRRNKVGYWLDHATKAHIMRVITDNMKHIKVKDGDANIGDRQAVRVELQQT